MRAEVLAKTGVNRPPDLFTVGEPGVRATLVCALLCYALER